MKEEEAFEEAFERYGKRWQPGRGGAVDEALCQALVDFSRWCLRAQEKDHGPRGPIFCDLIVVEDFNALATNCHGHELVGLFSGVASTIFAGHHCFLSDRESLPTFGDPESQRLSAEALELFGSCKPLFKPEHFSKGARRLAALELLHLSFAFIVLHEAGHIIRCHPSYLRRRYGLGVYEEIPIQTKVLEGVPILKAFEWEADQFAASASYRLAHDLMTRVGALKHLRPLGVDYAWGLSVSMVFLAMAKLNGSWVKASATHPSALFRYMWSMHSVEKAPECVSLGPNGASLKAATAEVANWARRHSVVGVSSLKEVDSSSVAVEMAEEYNDIKEILTSEKELLLELDLERRKGIDPARRK